MTANAKLIKPWFLALSTLHFLISCFLMLFGLSTAYLSAATGSGPGLLGYLLVVLQLPLFLLSTYGKTLLQDTIFEGHLEPSIPKVLVLMLITSLIYGYFIARLLLRFRRNPENDLRDEGGPPQALP
jgi:hypothetical protein